MCVEALVDCLPQPLVEDGDVLRRRRRLNDVGALLAAPRIGLAERAAKFIVNVPESGFAIRVCGVRRERR